MNQDHPPEQTINEDGSMTMEQNFEVPFPDTSEYERYADSPYVKQVLYQASCGICSDSLKPVEDNLRQGEEVIDIGGMSIDELKTFFGVSTEKELEEILGGKEGLKETLDSKNGCIGSLVGFTDLSLLEDFATEKRKLEQGVFPENLNECIVGTAFAEKNNLKVGDIISVSGPSRSMDKEAINLTVVGIFGDYFNEANAITFGTFYGDIYTTYHLLMNATALDNVVLSMEISKNKSVDKKKDAVSLLEKVGISEETAKRKALKLSGGEQQRVAIARALAHAPDIILADEPTGNLDEETGKNIMEIFECLAHQEGKCVIIVTHSKEVSRYADELLELHQGKLLLRKS